MSCENEYVYFLENSLQYVTKIEQNKTLFQLSPVFREYVKTKTISI